MGFLPSLGRFATIVVLFIASIVIVKRLHDLERPGVELFLLLIPIYNAFFALKLICKPGTPGANIFGPNPVEVKAGTAKSGFIRPTRSFRSRDLIERATYRTSFH